MQKNTRSGFTVVEILVVISIIGLLSATLLVGLGGLRAKGRDSRRISDLRQVQTSLELYFAKEGRYPDASDWNDLKGILTTAGIGVSKLPDDPAGDDSEYGYGTNDSGSKYVLAAFLEEPGSNLLRDSYPPPGDDISDFDNCGQEEDGRGIYCLSL